MVLYSGTVSGHEFFFIYLKYCMQLAVSKSVAKRSVVCPESRYESVSVSILNNYKRGTFFIFPLYIQHCFIGQPPDSTVSEDAGMEPRTIDTLHCQPDAVNTRLDLIYQM